MIVRPATPDDLPWLHTQCRAFSDAFGSRRPLYGDQDYVDFRLRDLMANHVFLVAEREAAKPWDRALVGLVAGLLLPHFINPAIRTLCEVLWWVPEAFRGGRAAVLLLDAFVEHGRQLADWVSFSLSAMTRVHPKALLNRGFRPCEQNFLLEIAA